VFGGHRHQELDEAGPGPGAALMAPSAGRDVRASLSRGASVDSVDGRKWGWSWLEVQGSGASQVPHVVGRGNHPRCGRWWIGAALSCRCPAAASNLEIHQLDRLPERHRHRGRHGLPPKHAPRACHHPLDTAVHHGQRDNESTADPLHQDHHVFLLLTWVKTPSMIIPAATPPRPRSRSWLHLLPRP